MHRPFLPSLAVAMSLALAAPLAVAATPVADAKPASAAAAVLPASNPFAAPSTLLYQAPQFDRIKDADYAPALIAGMAQQRSEVDAIANNPAPATFENTIVAMEKSGALLGRTANIFFSVTGAHINDTLRAVQSDMAPKLSQHRDAIYLDGKLFARVQSVYDQRTSLGLDPESLRLVERYQLQFVRAGAKLSDADKTKMRALNAELATLSTEFGKRVQDDSNESAVVVTDKAQLAGLSDGEIAAAAQAAKARKLDGKWLITLQNTTTQPALASLSNRDLRERIFKASSARGSHGGANDTTEIVEKIAPLRAQRAALLGYPNYAAYVLEDQMAKTPEAASKLLTDIVPAATANARAEAAKIQALIDSQAKANGNKPFKLQPWDWDFYAEQVRKAEFDLDESQIKPYFELDRVLKDGVFLAAEKLYGLTFKERKDLPVYHPDVRVFEVFADGKSSGLIYLDYYTRDSKRGGAWMNAFVGQSDLLGTRPVISNNMNIVKPAPGTPTLLSFDEANTMFHEFGHALHGLLSNTRYPMFSGTSTPRDFVEFPSQFNENWALEPTIFASYARHYETGKPMPAELVRKIKNARTFNQGYATVEYLGPTLLDLDWHALPADAPKQDALKFESATLAKYGLAMDEVPPRYRTAYFSHVWGGGYAAGYYAYLWTEVLAQDAFEWFKEHGGMTRQNGEIFKDKILSRGGTMDAKQLYLNFRGQEPSVEPLLEHRGLKPAAATPAVAVEVR